MSKQDVLQFKGKVVEILKNAQFRVLLENGHTITAYTGGKLKKNKIRMIRGDRVSVEISPYDLTKGRIVYRLKR